MRLPLVRPALPLVAAVFAASLPASQALAAPAGACVFDEVLLRLPAGEEIDFETGLYGAEDHPAYVFTQAQLAMHSGGVRMDQPRFEDGRRYVPAAMDADWRFSWEGHVFAMPRGASGRADGKLMLMVRRADRPVVDLMLGRCEEDGFDRDAFAAEFFNGRRAEEAASGE